MILFIRLIILFSLTRLNNIISGHIIGTSVTCDNEGEVIDVQHISTIKCYDCSCKNGFVVCTKRNCSAENCNVIHKEECCPNCKDVYKLANSSKSSCMFNNKIYESGTHFVINDCTNCTCLNSAVHCEKKRCPILECNWKNQIVLPGQCCAQCKAEDNDMKENQYKDNYEQDNEVLVRFTKKNSKSDQVQNEIDCGNGDELYKNGNIRDSTQFTEEKIDCSKIMCPAVICPSDSVLEVPENQCCPICMQSDGICTIYGGKHFRSFDGKMFSFVGSCNYQLTSDCDSESFNIELKTTALRNDVTIKRISVKLGDLNIDLLQNRNIEINNEVIDLPFQLTNKLEVVQSKENVIISSKDGIIIHWNYVSFLEVTVSKSYRKKLCGLCGNFNSIKEDDFITREGIMVEDAAILAQSWTSGDEICLDTRNYGMRECDSQKNQRLCSYMKGSVFEKCLKKLNVTSYYESCLKDICECPPGDHQCHCESFNNYVRDCRVLGILLPRWRKSLGCGI